MKLPIALASVVVLAGLSSSVRAVCPYGHGEPTLHDVDTERPTPEYTAALKALDVASVMDDLGSLMTDSQDWWPADYGNYGPLFVRLAWHCSGSYRKTDGRGGCSGGRQRFDPERSWEDNTNLDKARRLLRPVKEKYGLGLSWGDLFVMAGTVAIQSMGGPTLGVCVGRVDDPNGDRSAILGPSPEHEEYAPCEENGKCGPPMGQTTMELIYVNPVGPMGVPDPAGSAAEIRDTFARMGMNDRQTVALIGGGHAFGKTHGACAGSPGLSPKKTDEAGLDGDVEAWRGECGEGAGKGKGVNTLTSGLEGAWTSNPTLWDNDYFKNLIDFEWEVHEGPGGNHQWRVADEKARKGWNAKAPMVNLTGAQEIMMLTSDVALIKDPKYLEIVKEFASDQSALDEAFAEAWHKLTTQAFGSHVEPRCVSDASSCAASQTCAAAGETDLVETKCSMATA